MSEIDWEREAINANAIKLPTPETVRVEKVDETVTKILGFPVLVNDSRLIKLVVEWKNKTASSVDNVDKMDNFLRDPGFIKALKKTFNVS